jgi:hypothetical protein
MDAIQGTYRDGHVELKKAVDWPDGMHVTVQPSAMSDDDPPGTRLPSVRLADGSVLPWSDTREFRAALIAQMDSREPVELTPEEEAAWQADRKWIKDCTLQAVRREMGLNP